MIHYIDTHCHLFWDSFKEDIDLVISRANDEGVSRIIMPTTSFNTMEQARSIVSSFENVFLAAGIHPHDAKGMRDDFIDRLENFIDENAVVAIGEIGLDYYYDFCPKKKQQETLHAQLVLASELNLPVVIHNRDSDDDLYSICREHQGENLKGQFHCFSSSPSFAEKVLDLGFHISFTGNITFRKDEYKDILRVIPDTRLLLETDAPFMTPIPHRGKRNEPSYIPLIASVIADTRQQPIEYISEITTKNAELLFNI